MSNAIVVPDTFKGPVASAFQGQAAGDDLSGGITGGYGIIKYKGKVWSIQYNGNTLVLMRDDGDGPRGSIDVVILKANALLSKTFYLNGWDENNNNPPDCASEDGIVPDAGVPHPQSPACATCPRNAWGSAGGTSKGKACGDHRRLAVVPKDDLRNEAFGGPLLLRVPAASLKDMAAFDSRYKAMGYPYFTMSLKIGFDPAESYPKFVFNAIRPLDENEGKVVMEMRDSDEVRRVIGERGPAPVAQQIAAPAAGAFLEAPPANTAAAQVAAQPPAAQQPAAAPVAQPATAPQTSVGAGGFGAAAPVAAAPAPVAAPVTAPAAVAQPDPVAQPAPVAAAQPAAAPQAARPAVAMTGFGAAAPEVPAEVTAAPMTAPAVAQPATTAQIAPATAPEATTAAPAASPAPVSPGVVSAFEGSIDERLQALLG